MQGPADSSEEEEEEENEYDYTDKFIVREDEEEEEEAEGSEGSEGERRKKKHKRRRDEFQLEEEDYELLEENQVRHGKAHCRICNQLLCPCMGRRWGTRFQNEKAATAAFEGLLTSQLFLLGRRQGHG